MAITKLKGTQIFDGTITSANIDDGLEKEFTKVRVTTGDSSPDFLSSKILAGDNITLNVIGASGSAQYLTITASAGGGGGGDSFFASTTTDSIFTTGSAAFRGGESSVDSPYDKGTNVFFYVSGSISGSGANDRRSMFGGDLVVSGALQQGRLTLATGQYSHAEGNLSIASGIYSHAEGQSNVASGQYSHAEGTSSDATATASHAEGLGTTASGAYSHAEGYITTAAGQAAHAEGQSTSAPASYSHAEGYLTVASGSHSHAQGIQTTTIGTYSLAAGQGTISSGSAQAVFGKFNVRSNPTSLFIIGDGTATGDATRGDILRVNAGSAIGRGRFDITGSLAASLGISGSLTQLVDGTSYLVAGTNVTISSASNGQVTISSTGGAGTPAGTNQQIQFNDNGSFGASGNLSFDSANNVLSLTGSFGMKGNVTPDADTTYDLGSSEKRWANVYTGDLHLRNDRGDWTIVEERDYLCVVNNITGKKYKMMLQPLVSE